MSASRRSSLATPSHEAGSRRHSNQAGSSRHLEPIDIEAAEWPSELTAMYPEETSTSPYSLPSAIVDAYMGSPTTIHGTLDPSEGDYQPLSAKYPFEQSTSSKAEPSDSGIARSRTQSNASGFGYVHSALAEVKIRQSMDSLRSRSSIPSQDLGPRLSVDSNHSFAAEPLASRSLSTPASPPNMTARPSISSSASASSLPRPSSARNPDGRPAIQQKSARRASMARRAERAAVGQTSTPTAVSTERHQSANDVFDTSPAPAQPAECAAYLYSPEPELTVPNCRYPDIAPHLDISPDSDSFASAFSAFGMEKPKQGPVFRDPFSIGTNTIEREPSPLSVDQQLSEARMAALRQNPDLDGGYRNNSFGSQDQYELASDRNEALGVDRSRQASDAASQLRRSSGQSRRVSDTSKVDTPRRPSTKADDLEQAGTARSLTPNQSPASRADAKARAAAFVADLKRAKALQQSRNGDSSTNLAAMPDDSSAVTAPTLEREAPVVSPDELGIEAPAATTTDTAASVTPEPPPLPSKSPTPTLAQNGFFYSRNDGSPTLTRQSEPANPNLNYSLLSSARSRQLPHFISLHDIRRCRLPRERAHLYAVKTREIMNEGSAVHVWLTSVRTSSPSDALHRRSPRSNREQPSGGSAITFPGRGDGGRAREIPQASFVPSRDLTPNLPFAGLAPGAAQHQYQPPIPQRSSSAMSVNRPPSILSGKTGGGGFFSSIGKRTSRKSESTPVPSSSSSQQRAVSFGGRTITSPFAHLTIGVSVPNLDANSLAHASSSPPMNSHYVAHDSAGQDYAAYAGHAHHPTSFSPATISGPRMPGQSPSGSSRPSFDTAPMPTYASRSVPVVTSTAPSSSPAALGPSAHAPPARTSGQGMSIEDIESMPEFDAKMQQLVDVLPHETRSTLIEWLVRANFDENAAISMYLADSAQQRP